MPKVIIEYISEGASRVLGDLRNIANTASGVSKSAGGMGATFKNAFGGIVSNIASGVWNQFTGAVRGSLDAFLEYEDGMVKFQAISGATSESMSALSAEVMRLGSTTPFTIGEVSQMTISLARAGFTAEQATASLDGIVKGSLASGESLEKFGSILGSAASTFGFFEPGSVEILGEEFDTVSAKMQRATELIVAGANSADQSVADVGGALKNMSGAATVANKGIEDAIYMTQVLAATGVRGGEAGTVGKNWFNTMTEANGLLTGSIDTASNQSMKAAAVFKKYGISLADSNGELLDAPQLMARVSTAFQSIEDPAERAAAATEAFGRLHGAKIAAILGLSVEKLESLNAAQLNSASAFKTTSDVMQTGFAAALAKLDSAVNGLQVQLASALAPALILATDLFTGFLNAVGGAAGTVGGADFLKSIYDQVIQFGELIGQSVGEIIAEFIGLGTAVMQNIAPAFGGFIGATTDHLFSLANIIEVILQKMGNSPAVIGIIGGVISSILNLATFMTTVITDGLNFLFETFSGLDFGALGDSGIGEMVASWTETFQNFGDVAGSAFDAIAPKVMSVMGTLGGALGGALGAIFNRIVELGTTLSEVFNNILPAIQQFGSELYDRISPALEGLVANLQGMFGTIEGSANIAGGGLSQIVTMLGHMIVSLLQSDFLINGVALGIKTIVAVMNAIITIVRAVMVIGAAIGFVIQTIVGAMNAVYEAVQKVVTALQNLNLGSFVKLAKGDWEGFMNDMKGDTEGLGDELGGNLESAFENLEGVDVPISADTKKLTDDLQKARDAAESAGDGGLTQEQVESTRELVKAAQEKAAANEESLKKLREEQKEVQSLNTASAEERAQKEAKLKKIQEGISALKKENEVIKTQGSEAAKIVATYDSQLDAYVSGTAQKAQAEQELTNTIVDENAEREASIPDETGEISTEISQDITQDISTGETGVDTGEISANASAELAQNPAELPVEMSVDESSAEQAAKDAAQAARDAAEAQLGSQTLALQQDVEAGKISQEDADIEVRKLTAEMNLKLAVTDAEKAAAMKELRAIENEIATKAIEDELQRFQTAQDRKKTIIERQSLAIDKNVQGFEAETRAIEMATKALEAQQALMEAQFGIEEAQAELQNALSDAQLDRLSSAQDIAKQLQDESLTAEKRKRLEQEMTKLGFDRNANELQVLEARNRKEAQLDAQKKQQMEAEFTRETAINELEAQRNLQIARRAELEAKIAAMKANQDVLSAQQAELDAQVKIKEAQAEIQKARLTGDAEAIAAAEAKLDAANFELEASKNQIALSKQIAAESQNNIAFSQQEVKNTEKINQAQAEQLRLQQEAKRVAMERELESNKFNRDMAVIDAKIEMQDQIDTLEGELELKPKVSEEEQKKLDQDEKKRQLERLKQAQNTANQNPVTTRYEDDASGLSGDSELGVNTSELDSKIKSLEMEIDMSTQLGLDTTGAQSELDLLKQKKDQLTQKDTVEQEIIQTQDGIASQLDQQKLELANAQAAQEQLKTELLERQLQIMAAQLQLQTQLAAIEAKGALADQQNLVAQQEQDLEATKKAFGEGGLTQEERDYIKQAEDELKAEKDRLAQIQQESASYDALAQKANELASQSGLTDTSKENIASTEEKTLATEQALLEVEKQRAEIAERTARAKESAGGVIWGMDARAADSIKSGARRIGGYVQANRLYEVAESGRELIATANGMGILSGDSKKTYFVPSESGYVHNTHETESILAGKRKARYGHSVAAKLASSQVSKLSHDAKTQKLLESINQKLDKLGQPELQINGLSIKNTISNLSDLRVANIAENKLLDELKRLKRKLGH